MTKKRSASLPDQVLLWVEKNAEHIARLITAQYLSSDHVVRVVHVSFFPATWLIDDSLPGYVADDEARPQVLIEAETAGGRREQTCLLLCLHGVIRRATLGDAICHARAVSQALAGPPVRLVGVDSTIASPCVMDSRSDPRVVIVSTFNSDLVGAINRQGFAHLLVDFDAPSVAQLLSLPTPRPYGEDLPRSALKTAGDPDPSLN